jgi:hypothetical protein
MKEHDEHRGVMHSMQGHNTMNQHTIRPSRRKHNAPFLHHRIIGHLTELLARRCHGGSTKSTSSSDTATGKGDWKEVNESQEGAGSGGRGMVMAPSGECVRANTVCVAGSAANGVV